MNDWISKGKEKEMKNRGSIRTSFVIIKLESSLLRFIDLTRAVGCQGRVPQTANRNTSLPPECINPRTQDVSLLATTKSPLLLHRFQSKSWKSASVPPQRRVALSGLLELLFLNSVWASYILFLSSLSIYHINNPSSFSSSIYTIYKNSIKINLHRQQKRTEWKSY